MRVSVRYLPSSGFLFALFCFLLPFVTMSCPAGQLTLSGLQVATGTTIAEEQTFGEAGQREIDGEPLAFAALVCALLGLGTGFLAQRAARFLAAAVGCLGATLLLMLGGKIEVDALKQGGGMLKVSYEAGYWLALLAFAAAAVLNLVIARKSRAPAVAAQQEAVSS